MKKILGFLFLGVMVVGFQNCSKVAFNAVDTGLTKSGFVAGPEISEIIKDDAVDTNDVVVVEEDKKNEEVVVVAEEKKDEEKKNDEVVVVEEKKDEEKKHEEVAVVEDDRDDDKDEDKKDKEEKRDEVIVADKDEHDDDKKDNDEDDCDNDGEDKKDDEKKDHVAKNEDDDHGDDKDKDKEHKHDDLLTEEQTDLFACASDDGDNSKKVLICHYPPGNSANRHTICIARPALKAHMSHGKGSAVDTIGACGDDAIAGNQ